VPPFNASVEPQSPVTAVLLAVKDTRVLVQAPLPPPARELQPNPLLVVQVNAELAVLQDGTAKSVGAAGLAVAFPLTVFEVALASLALVIRPLAICPIAIEPDKLVKSG